MKNKHNLLLVIILMILYYSTNLYSLNNATMNGTLIPNASFLGLQYRERVGYVLSSAGDINDDGYDDFMIGTFHNKTNGPDAGAVYLILGRPNLDWGMKTMLTEADARFLGEKQMEAVGFAIAGQGDVNGDGISDILIGAPAGNDRIKYNPGRMYVVLGKPTADWGYDCYLVDESDAMYVGEEQQNLAGRAVAIIGDLNGDGCDEMLCAAPYNDYGALDAGKVYLILGKHDGWNKNDKLTNAAASFYYTKQYGTCGYSVASVGDVNNDGVPDFAIGASGASRVFVMFGRKSVNWGENFNLENADLIIRNSNLYKNDALGYIVDGAGDVNGDNISDIVISALNNNDGGNYAGKIYLVFGRSGGWESSDFSLAYADASYIGEYRNDQAGWGLGAAGDVNGDGYDDFLIGAWKNDYGFYDAGKAYLIYGKPTNWEQDVGLETIPTFFSGETDTNYAGYAVSTAGDVDGDRWDDFIISATYNNEVDEWSGQVYLFTNYRGKHTVSGYVNYYNSSHPITNNLITIESQKTLKDTTDNSGYYHFDVYEKADYLVYPFKKADEDVYNGCISSFDAALAARHSVKLQSLEEPFLKSADVNLDGKITAYDAALILQYSLNYPKVENSHVGEWIFIPENISISNILSDYNNQNFGALVRGDVNGDWSLESQLAKTINAVSTYDEVVCLSENEFFIPLEFNPGNKIISFDIEINYNSTIVKFIDVEKCEIAKDFQVETYIQKNGVLKIGAFSIYPVDESGIFLKIKFQCDHKENFSGFLKYKLRVNDGEFLSSKIAVGTTNKFGFQLNQNYPNPCNGIAIINYQLSQPGKVSFSIFNALGQNVFKKNVHKTAPGNYNFRWDGADFSGRKVSTGVYICQATYGNVQKQIKLLFIK